MTPTGPLPFASARFLAAAHTLAQLPPDAGAEVAVAGRSNAGKSSAINAITRAGLARTSKQPGRTQQIVFFELGPGRRLADLPGYGYARVPKALRTHWDRLLDAYLRRRACLQGLVVVMDVRHPLREGDEALLAWCAEAGRPVHVLLTKADKLRRGPALEMLREVEAALGAIHPGASVQLFSARTRQGVEEARAVLARWLTGSGAARPGARRITRKP